VNARPEPVVFILWGSYAQKKAAFVDSVDKGGRHLVLKSPHPSPLSAHNGFFGCKHFSKANAFLESQGMASIDWSLPAAEAAA
jgi:uracil-DNA glycosylase